MVATIQPLSLSLEEAEAGKKEHREQLLDREYMPAFRSPRPAEFDRFRSEHEERANLPFPLHATARINNR